MPNIITIPMLFTVPAKPLVIALIVSLPDIPDKRPITNAVHNKLIKAFALIFKQSVNNTIIPIINTNSIGI
jgi:hypothetical protein